MFGRKKKTSLTEVDVQQLQSDIVSDIQATDSLTIQVSDNDEFAFSFKDQETTSGVGAIVDNSDSIQDYVPLSEPRFPFAVGDKVTHSDWWPDSWIEVTGLGVTRFLGVSYKIVDTVPVAEEQEGVWHYDDTRPWLKVRKSDLPEIVPRNVSLLDADGTLVGVVAITNDEQVGWNIDVVQVSSSGEMIPVATYTGEPTATLTTVDCV